MSTRPVYPRRVAGLGMLALACLLCGAASADTVGPCGPHPNPGDYLLTPEGKVWCEMPGTGAWAALPHVLALLGNLYTFVTGLDVWLRFALGLGAVMWGTRLLGRPATVSGPVIGGTLYGTVQPAREGTAKSFGGRLLGTLLNLFGTVVLIMGVVSCVQGV